MAYYSKTSLETLEKNSNFKNTEGKYECVTLVQSVAGAPVTKDWIKGDKVIDRVPGSISPGTIIATFDETNKYPIGDKKKHAAVYKSHTSSEIEVIDQWQSQGMSKSRTIRFKNSPSVDQNDSKWYYIVE